MLHQISNFPVKRLYIHSPTSLLKPGFFFCLFVFLIVNDTTPPDQDMDSVCKMFLIRLLEKEYKVLAAQSLHHHEVWIV